ncbi:MAG: 2-hydroxyacyl-CoA dehydratase, partial [Desulfobacterales bacterium]|nr:2-hydroxyacyl-CoA dehydratase [Desulfobacterales bacterium]
DTCLDGLVMYNACDTLRNLPEILDIGLGKECDLPIYSLHVPALPMEQGGAGLYLRNGINALIAWLEETFQTRFSTADFKKSIALYSKARQLMAQGQVLVRQGRTSFADYATLCREIGFMAVEKQISLLEKFCAEQEKQPGHDNGTRPVLLSGILPPAKEIIHAMEAAGLRIAANDIASLHRSYACSPAETDDPADYYTHFYDNHFPCTTLLPLADKRIEALCSLMDSCRAEGFVFVGEKFCEYEYFELPYLEKKFREKGIKVLSLEFSLGDEQNLGPVKTRIEAYAEMMR